MKRKFILLGLILCPFIICGCMARVNLKEYMSEITTLYFEGKNENFSSSISVGEREKVYIIDGKSGENTDFSLISLKFSSPISDQQIIVEMSVNDKKEDVILYFNPLSNVYINDLGYALNAGDNLSLSYEGSTIEFVLQNFEIDYNQALTIAKDELKNEIKSNLKNGKLCGECYLKVLVSSDNDSKFWLFTLVNLEEENINILIDVHSGQIIRA